LVKRNQAGIYLSQCGYIVPLKRNPYLGSENFKIESDLVLQTTFTKCSDRVSIRPGLASSMDRRLMLLKIVEIVLNLT